ncbi:MAG: GMC family oxidoreductase [Streptosporangiaceae bacterium]
MSITDVADVVIVGGGTAGGIAARQLAEAGLRIVCLEQGRWVNRAEAELPGDKAGYELAADGPWHPDPNRRQRPEDYPVNVSESDLPMFMYNGVGGSSVLYGACWSRALPSDFRVRTLDGVADDWPLAYEELQPFYEQADLEMGVSGLGGNPAYPPGAPPPLPAHPIHLTGRKMAEGMNRLGWHWWPGYCSIPSRDYGPQHQCVRYGICRMGCPEGAKASTDVTHFPLAIERGAQVITGARAARITLNENGLADGVVYLREGRECFQPAAVVMLAAGGIGTPRLLLMSESGRFPDGLANSSGLVGKRLMLHPYATAVGRYDDDLEDWLGPVGEHIESMQFYETDISRGFVRGCKWLLPGTAGPLEVISRLTREDSADAEPLWGDRFAATMIASAGHLMAWDVIPEDLPEESNYVSLDPSLTDSDGLPAPAVHYRTSGNTVRMIEFNLARALESLQEAGAREVWVSGRNRTSGHIMGTAKMGEDPATSVVDRYGRCHDVANLFIVDSSVFTTSTGVNPAATICALAKRTCSHLLAGAPAQRAAA